MVKRGIESTANNASAYEPELWNKVAPSLAQHPSIVAAVVYADVASEGTASTTTTSETLAEVSIPVVHHLAGKASTSTSDPGTPTNNNKKSPALRKEYVYPAASSYKFATPFQPQFHYNTENISHTRNLILLKDKMGGPYFDLETIWEEHTWYEFADRSMEHTMSTMVQEPYVNHVPTVSPVSSRLVSSS